MKTITYMFKVLILTVICFLVFNPLYISFSANKNITYSYFSDQSDTGAITLCEQFSSALFPPGGWSLVYTGTLYWSRVTQSAFGQGVGSAMYNMWDAPNGTVQSLITPLITPTSAGDSIVMDMAYCDFGTSDSLFILTSTNGGTIFTTLVRIALLPPPFQCSPPPFVPTANDWRKMTFGPLPIGTNKISFTGRSGFGDNVYIDSICIKSALIGITHNIYNIPSEYSLSQNYPNPFNPKTVISYQLPVNSFVKISVYDIDGRIISELINQKQNAGIYKVDFNGTDLPSGVYFYKLETKGFSETKKMLMIK